MQPLNTENRSMLGTQIDPENLTEITPLMDKTHHVFENRLEEIEDVIKRFQNGITSVKLQGNVQLLVGVAIGLSLAYEIFNGSRMQAVNPNYLLAAFGMGLSIGVQLGITKMLIRIPSELIWYKKQVG